MKISSKKKAASAIGNTVVRDTPVLTAGPDGKPLVRGRRPSRRFHPVRTVRRELGRQTAVLPGISGTDLWNGPRFRSAGTPVTARPDKALQCFTRKAGTGP